MECAEVLASLQIPAPSEVRPMSGYEAAAVWRAVVAGRPLAVRVLRPGRSAEDEVAALSLAATATPLAPSIVATGQHDGQAVLVLTWCPGRPVTELIDADADADRLGRVFGAEQARINAAGVCHLDYQPFNVLAGPDGAITGVVDWSLARRDDPVHDVARTKVLLEFGAALVPDLPTQRFATAWQTGYDEVLRYPTGLAPYLAAAAEKQAADWAERAAAGEVPVALAEAAAAVQTRYRL